MKRYLSLLIALCSLFSLQAQLLNGTLDVNGMPSFIQSFQDTVQEAGIDDNSIGFESAIDANQISFVLNRILILSSSTLCSDNVFRYSVFMHTQNAPQNLTVKAKTYTNSGFRFPSFSIYDILIIKPLGPRDLTATNGGNYVTIPNDASQAIKVCEFVGCRTDIPIQFKIEASSLVQAGVSNFNIYYTVVASLL
ncbi:MAG: hypothetical protein NWQ06_07870 [Leeuwenhoekiella sp.]|nr:hypothetical protein [Leeuwenhoekiella sp.]